MQGKLTRTLSYREVVALSFGAMIGWSWVVMSGTWVINAGSLGAIAAFLVGGCVVLLVGLTYAELASSMPVAGGEHTYSHRALGSTASFICTWSILFGYVSVVSFEAVALPTVVEYILPNLNHIYLWTILDWDVHASWVMVGVSGAFLISLINILGIKTAARIQLLVTGMIIIGGLILLMGASKAGQISNLKSFLSKSNSRFFECIDHGAFYVCWV